MSIWTEEELKELVFTLMIGTWVREAVAEANGEDISKFNKQVKKFLELAENLGYKQLIQYFHGSLLPSDKLCSEEEKVLEYYNDLTFWEELELRLGQRDFFKEVTKLQLREIKKKHSLPDKIHSYYEKYRKEFEKNGIDRLEIAKPGMKY